MVKPFAFTFGGMVGASSDTEDGMFFSDDQGEHSVEKFMPCSLRIIRAVRSCNDAYTKKSCARWLWRVTSLWM